MSFELVFPQIVNVGDSPGHGFPGLDLNTQTKKGFKSLLYLQLAAIHSYPVQVSSHFPFHLSQYGKCHVCAR